MSLTTPDAQLEKIVDQTLLLRQNLQEMINILTPVGVVQAFAGATTPDGWLLCDGSAVSREDYADLYAVIGDTYGSGDGSTTFNLPDLSDKFIQGNATAGTVKAAGLPNIKGLFSSPASIEFTGAFAKKLSFDNKFYIQNTYPVDYIQATFDASRSSAVYSDDVTTVQPPAVTMRYIIKC